MTKWRNFLVALRSRQENTFNDINKLAVYAQNLGKHERGLEFRGPDDSIGDSPPDLSPRTVDEFRPNSDHITA
jgi:hypothetical protein